jgi:gas vesicle structural protein
MAVERTGSSSSIIDVLDRVLDKGIVIDAWVRLSLVGIDLLTVEARVVVASIETYLRYSEAVSQVTPVSKPALAGPTPLVPPPSALDLQVPISERLRRP